MHERTTRHDTSSPARPRASRVPQPNDLAAAGNRAMREVLAPRPVQRWPDFGDLPSMPDLSSYVPDIPGVNFNLDTDAGTASGGFDFHNGTQGSASYGPGGVDLAGAYGSGTVNAHAGAANDWNVHGGTTTSGGTKVGGSLSDDHGAFGGTLGVLGSDGDSGSLSAHGGRGGFGGLGSYAGQFGNLELPF
jgi:hypothetical protein